MKGFDKKGVSPVIATILLIALTVAAVGIVAVVLSTISPTGAGLNVILALKEVDNAYISPGNDNNEMKINLTNWGPDDIISGSLSISIDGMLDRDYYPESPHWESGSAERLPDTGAPGAVLSTISWVTADPPIYVKAGMWPWKVSSGSQLSIILKGGNASDFKPTGIVIRDATTKTVLFQSTSLPDPT